jgi:hypothetical protein
MTTRDHAQALLTGFRACLAGGPTASGPLDQLATAVERVPLRLLGGVDETLRQGFPRYSEGGWPAFDAKELTRFIRAPRKWGFLAVVPPPEGWAVLAVASSHWNGHLRQAAVEGLSADGRALPFIVLRLNDWVSEVQAAARAALDSFLRRELAAHLVSVLPLLWGLQRQRRANHAEVVDRVLSFLRSAAAQPAVRSGCHSPEREVRRGCYEIALQSECSDRAALLGEALADPEPAVRYWAVRQVAKAFPEPWTEPLAAKALIDRSVQVRRVALGALAPRLPPARARQLIEEALLDINPTARWQARALILQPGPFDLAAFYRSALETAGSPARLRGALLGLGESGTPEDPSVISGYLTAERLSVRCAALRALADLEPLATTAPFLEALGAPQSSVSREGRRALEPRLGKVSATTIGALIVDQGREAHVRRNALSLANRLSKWERLPLLLDGCADHDAMTSKMALRLVEGWLAAYNRSFLQPTREQLDRAADALARIPALTRRRVSEHIAQILETLRR